MPDDATQTYRVAISSYMLDGKIPKDDPFWPKFNSSFQNRNVDTFSLASAIWDGRSLTTWHRDHWRNATNFECGQHLGLDFDGGDMARIDRLAKDEFVREYGSILYTTPSHTEEAPRARALFLLDKPIMQAANYTAAAAALLWAFGTADRSCRDSCRFFYGSKGCEIDCLDRVLPLEVVKKLIARYKETGDREKRRHSNYVNTNTDMAEVDDALRRINPLPPSLDYGEWISILMALHHTYGDAALPLAVSWGQGEGDEIERRWKGFAASAGQPQVGLGTIFLIAKRFGWEKKQDFLKSDWKVK